MASFCLRFYFGVDSDLMKASPPLWCVLVEPVEQKDDLFHAVSFVLSVFFQLGVLCLSWGITTE